MRFSDNMPIIIRIIHLHSVKLVFAVTQKLTLTNIVLQKITCWARYQKHTQKIDACKNEFCFHWNLCSKMQINIENQAETTKTKKTIKYFAIKWSATKTRSLELHTNNSIYCFAIFCFIFRLIFRVWIVDILLVGSHFNGARMYVTLWIFL